MAEHMETELIETPVGQSTGPSEESQNQLPASTPSATSSDAWDPLLNASDASSDSLGTPPPITENLLIELQSPPLEPSAPPPEEAPLIEFDSPRLGPATNPPEQLLTPLGSPLLEQVPPTSECLNVEVSADEMRRLREGQNVGVMLKLVTAAHQEFPAAQQEVPAAQQEVPAAQQTQPAAQPTPPEQQPILARPRPSLSKKFHKCLRRISFVAIVWIVAHMYTEDTALVVQAAARDTGLRVRASIKADVGTLIQWGKNDVSAVTTVVAEGQDKLDDRIRQVLGKAIDRVEEWRFGSVGNFDLAPPPGEVDPDKFYEWGSNRQVKAWAWLVCEAKTMKWTVRSLKHSHPPTLWTSTDKHPFLLPKAESSTSRCDIHLWKDFCLPAVPSNFNEDWLRCQQLRCRQSSERDLPKHIRQWLMLVHGPAWMSAALHELYEDIPRKNHSKTQCRWAVDARLTKERDMHKFMDYMLATVDLKIDRSESTLNPKFEKLPTGLGLKYLKTIPAKEENSDPFKPGYWWCDNIQGEDFGNYRLSLSKNTTSDED